MSEEVRHEVLFKTIIDGKFEFFKKLVTVKDVLLKNEENESLAYMAVKYEKTDILDYLSGPRELC